MMKIMPLLNILVNLQWSGRYNIDWLIGHIPFTWMLDSACTYHYTSHREWFHTYDRPNNRGSISLGDDHPCLVAGVGTIRVRMFDGVVRTLSNVKYVLELKKNLISLDYLEEHGYAFSC